MTEPGDLLHSTWPALLERLGEAVIIMDRGRTLRFVNERARLLLGYHEGDVIGDRCRLVTRGMDCEGACPLTFALERGLELVDGFSTVYRTRDGRPIPLSVTVIPLRSPDGELHGAVEILRPVEPDLGFYLAGDSLVAQGLRRRIGELARSRQSVVLVGEAASCGDVAGALHRLAGLPDSLFRLWRGLPSQEPDWPPGTLYSADGSAPEEIPAGWRLVLAAGSVDAVAAPEGSVVVELPPPEDRRSDLPLMLVAWAQRMSPGLAVETDALEHLSRLAFERGLDGIEPVLVTAVASAGGCLSLGHVAAQVGEAVPVDEMLTSGRPLAALEERLLREVLQRCGWRMQEAADLLGISRVTLWRKLREHGIERPCAGGPG